MQDLLSLLDTIRRPRLLIRAARIGSEHYRRNPHLNRLLGEAVLPRNGPALLRLIEIEAEMNASRESRQAAYSVSQHVEVLCAMIGEAQLLRALS